MVVIVPLDLILEDGPNIGAGFVRLIGLVLVLIATVRLARGVAKAGRTG